MALLGPWLTPWGWGSELAPWMGWSGRRVDLGALPAPLVLLQFRELSHPSKVTVGVLVSL